MQSFCSILGRHVTLSLLTVTTNSLVECIIEPAIATCVSDFVGAIKREKKEVGRIILPYRQHLFMAADIMIMTNIKEWLNFIFHNDIEYILFQQQGWRCMTNNRPHMATLRSHTLHSHTLHRPTLRSPTLNNRTLNSHTASQWLPPLL